ncbi:hypothetical protein HanRHA438_Chr06g0260871 [Helianthus annuus]|nr:hypothetical protein HanRHA438_Chr06g0260871 [Helianthus annuus]
MQRMSDRFDNVLGCHVHAYYIRCVWLYTYVTPQISPRVTSGPGGEYRDVVDIIIVKQHKL